MEVKTDTKEKLHVICVSTPLLTANMAAELYSQLVPLLQATPKNIVLNLKDTKSIDEKAADIVVKMQQKFYEEDASFVICNLNPDVEAFLDKTDMLELINVTPTEIEARDIVQMEEIERDLMDEEE